MSGPLSSSRYWIVSPTGQQEGPFELSSLIEWIGIGRIEPDTVLIDDRVGLPTTAKSIPELAFAFNQPVGTMLSHGSGTAMSEQDLILASSASYVKKPWWTPGDVLGCVLEGCLPGCFSGGCLGFCLLLVIPGLAMIHYSFLAHLIGRH